MRISLSMRWIARGTLFTSLPLMFLKRYFTLDSLILFLFSALIVIVCPSSLQSMQVEEKEKSIEDSDFSGVLQAFLSVTGEEDAEVLRGFLARISSGDINDNAFILLSPDSDKAHRTVSFFSNLLTFAFEVFHTNFLNSV